MYSHSMLLAKSLAAPLVVFDLEHTGGKKESRGITEFAAVVIEPGKPVVQYSTLVKPASHAYFEPYVCRLTGIWPHTVSSAPSWATVMDDFVVPHKDSIWVGFNSRSADMPIIRAESTLAGQDLTDMKQLDLLRLGLNLSGSLSTRVGKLWPDTDLSGVHRAMKDAYLTLLLLEGIMIQGYPLQDMLSRGEIELGTNQSPLTKLRVRRKGKAFDKSFLETGEVRQGLQWLVEESLWVADQFKQGETVEKLASSVGRTPFAIACFLNKEQLLERHTRNLYRTRATKE